MRILLINDYATPTGGAELMLLMLRDALRRRGHDARIFASSARPLGLPSQADYQCFGVSSILRGVSQVVNPSAYMKLRGVLSRFQPHVVHVRLFLSQLSPLILPLLETVPAVFHVAWYRSICPLGTKMLPNGDPCRKPAGLACLNGGCVPAYAWPSTMLQMHLWRRWRSVFGKIVANSHATKTRLENEGISPIEVVWNGVPQRNTRQVLSPFPTIVFAGRLVREKGADLLLQAFAQIVQRIPRARLLIAGDGPERLRLIRQIQELRLENSASLLGHLSREQLDQTFQDAWVQVVPSRWEEPFGISAAEGLMRGTAVVASDTGGLAEIITTDETGLLVAPRSAESLAEAIFSLIDDPARNLHIGRSGRNFALKHLTEKAFVDRFIQIYLELCPLLQDKIKLDG